MPRDGDRGVRTSEKCDADTGSWRGELRIAKGGYEETKVEAC